MTSLPSRGIGLLELCPPFGAEGPFSSHSHQMRTLTIGEPFVYDCKGGHSDYLVLPSEHGLKVHLEAGDKTQEMDIDEFLTVFMGVQDLVRGLRTAILVIIHRLDERTKETPPVTPQGALS